MRAPHRKNPRKADRFVPGPDSDLSTMADEADYVISTEHKDYLTSAGPGNLRSDATRCPEDSISMRSEAGSKRPSAQETSAH